MEYTKLGNTDMEVSKICVGAIKANPKPGVTLLDEKKK